MNWDWLHHPQPWQFVVAFAVMLMTALACVLAHESKKPTWPFFIAMLLAFVAVVWIGVHLLYASIVFP